MITGKSRGIRGRIGVRQTLENIPEHLERGICRVDVHGRIGQGFQGTVDLCHVTFSDGRREWMARKTARGPLGVSSPLDVLNWQQTHEDLQDAGIPQPKKAIAVVRKERGSRIGEFFLQLLDPDKIVDVRGTDNLSFDKPVKLRSLDARRHAYAIRVIGRTLARLHAKKYPGAFADFGIIIRHGDARGFAVLDYGKLRKISNAQSFLLQSSKALQRHADAFVSEAAVRLFLEAHEKAATDEVPVLLKVQARNRRLYGPSRS